MVYVDGNYYCRKCEARGWWSEERPDPAELAAKRLVAEQERNKRREQIARCQDWQVYHQQVSQGVNYWLSTGIDETDIRRWGLGFCSKAPCTDYDTPSLTIPIMRHQRLVDIRHRLINPLDGQKYRSHLPGLPPSFFNLDSVPDGEVIYIVEGEKKAIVLEHYGLHPVISFPGLNYATHLLHSLAQCATKSQRLAFLPDPDSVATLMSTMRQFRQEGFRVGLVELMRKPDDFVLAYGVEALHNAILYQQAL